MIVTGDVSLLMHELLPLNLNFQVKNEQITLFVAFKAIFRASIIKAFGIFNFHGEVGSNKQFPLKITVIDMSFCL